jgi:hypothetical protein
MGRKQTSKRNKATTTAVQKDVRQDKEVMEEKRMVEN